MRTNTAVFDSYNNATSKEIRLVVVIKYATPVYITSHDDIVIAGADVLSGVLKNTSASSQKLNPLEARGEIGTINFQVVDVGGLVTDKLREKDLLDEGLKGRTVELYLGWGGLDFADYRLEQTQVIDKQVTFDGGTYIFNCRDIQREMRKGIFDRAKTRVSQDFLVGETTTLNVLTTDGFEPCVHGSEWGQDPNSTIRYLQITTDKIFEIISATGKSASTFTGLTRGLFGTDEIPHNIPVGGSNETSGPEVKELVYIEGTAPHLAYQLLTGKNFSDADTLPISWTLGINQDFVDKPSFENVGIDLHDPLDSLKGFIVRGDGLTKTDGKRFIEKELCLLMGCFLLVGPDGKIYLKRMSGVLSDADYIATLNSANIVKATGYKHDLNDIKNVLKIDWAYIATLSNQAADYYRTNALIDSASATKHGESKHYEMKFKMLHTARHTPTTLNTIFNGLRDRHSGPSEKVMLELLPSLNNVEVGDVHLVDVTHLRDYQGASALNRPMEVQQRTINQISQKVTVSMFGSSAEASPLSLGSSESSELPDPWYSSAGIDLSTLVIVDVSGFINSSDTLIAGTITRTIYYYIGDLTIASGQVLTIQGNSELRVMGHFQLEGDLKIEGIAGGDYLGIGGGGDSLWIGGANDGIAFGELVQGDNDSLPNLLITNSDGVFSGIPLDMRGIDGGKGADLNEWVIGDQVYERIATGGAGGMGGGSTIIVSRGMGFGAAGQLNLSGAAGEIGGDKLAGRPAQPNPEDFNAGSGMGGAPGCAVIMIDGTQGTTFPVLSGNVVADYGNSPSPGAGKGDVSLGTSTSMVLYVPPSAIGYPSFP